MKKDTKRIMPLSSWGIEAGSGGEMMIDGCRAVHLAEIYGTPLHVVNENQLVITAKDFLTSFSSRYAGKVSVHYAFKCNSVPAIVAIIKKAGLNAEVMSEYELKLALSLDYKGENIIVNGPYKPDNFLKICMENNVRLIIIDSLAELDNLVRLGKMYDKRVNILLRINPDYIPSGMNQGSATGSRKGCAFGLDLKGTEVYQALDRLAKNDFINFQGFQFHIGTGIASPVDYRRALLRLKQLVDHTLKRGLEIKIFDIGGGIAAPASREMTTFEMLIYQGWEILPGIKRPAKQFSFRDFADAVTEGLLQLFGSADLPELIVEPGRCITSSSQLLLLGIHQVKNRPGIKKWIITNGGIGTVTMPTYYEYHEVFLCNDLTRPRTENVTITGPVCFASDIVYRNKRMPVLYPGEILAVMDSGAYFTAWESSFGFPHPAIVAVADGKHRMVRRRESYDDMITRDLEPISAAGL